MAQANIGCLIQPQGEGFVLRETADFNYCGYVRKGSVGRVSCEELICFISITQVLHNYCKTVIVTYVFVLLIRDSLRDRLYKI